MSRPQAAQEVGDLAYATSFLVGTLEKGPVSEDTADLARSLREHLRELERALSGRPAEPEENPLEGNPPEESPEEGAEETSEENLQETSDREDPEGDGLSAVLRRRFETPINPSPTSRPLLVKRTELELSPETAETVGRAAGALDRFYRGPVSKSRIADVALRKLLYDLATDRENSVLAEWLRRAYGRREIQGRGNT